MSKQYSDWEWKQMKKSEKKTRKNRKQRRNLKNGGWGDIVEMQMEEEYHVS